MHALHIALQEGFAHDDVVVSMDSAQVFHGEDVSTRQQIGLAASFDLEVEPGAHAVELRLPKRGGLRRLQSVSVSGETWLGVTLRHDGQFDIRVSATPFGYM